MAKRRPDHDYKPLHPWDRPHWHSIEMKIGEGLREHYMPPEELPHKLLTLLMEMARRDAGGD